MTITIADRKYPKSKFIFDSDRMEVVGWYRTNKKYSNTTSGHISKYLGGIDAQKVPQEWIDQLLDKVEIKAP